MKKILSTAVATVFVAGVAALGPMAAADALPVATASKTYTSCAKMNAGKYPHGVGKKGAVDKTRGKRVRTFKVDNKAYKRYSTSASKGAYYRDLDRDNDGIACERK